MRFEKTILTRIYCSAITRKLGNKTAIEAAAAFAIKLLTSDPDKFTPLISQKMSLNEFVCLVISDEHQSAPSLTSTSKINEMQGVEDSDLTNNSDQAPEPGAPLSSGSATKDTQAKGSINNINAGIPNRPTSSADGQENIQNVCSATAMDSLLPQAEVTTGVKDPKVGHESSLLTPTTLVDVGITENSNHREALVMEVQEREVPPVVGDSSGASIDPQSISTSIINRSISQDTAVPAGQSLGHKGLIPRMLTHFL